MIYHTLRSFFVRFFLWSKICIITLFLIGSTTIPLFSYAQDGGNTPISIPNTNITNGNPSVTNQNYGGNMGIDCDRDRLAEGQCGFSIYKVLGIKQDTHEKSNVSVGLFVQDIVLASTFFIGTVVTIALITSGLMLIFSGANESLAQRAKSGITYSLIGMVIVASSYVIVRIIQFIAKG